MVSRVALRDVFATRLATRIFAVFLDGAEEGLFVIAAEQPHFAPAVNTVAIT